MPWQPSDALKHTSSANTAKKQRQWRDIANSVLQKTGNESQAIRTANGVVSRSAVKRRLMRKGQNG